jgi:carbamoyl-phosphate synthase large subunit
VDLIKDGAIAILVNTTEGAQSTRDSYSLRRAALMAKVPYYTTLAGAKAVLEGLRQLRSGNLEVTPLQSYFGPIA